MRLFGWLMCVLLFVTSALAVDSARQWAGCYVLRLSPDRPDAYRNLPRQFRLNTQPIYGDSFSLEVQDFGLLDFSVLEPIENREWPFSSWKPGPGKTITIDWGTGFVGYTVSLKKAGEHFTGVALYHTDDGRIYPELPVEARRIGCKRGK